MQVRSAKLADLPMTSLALLPQIGSEGLHPIVLAACYDNKVRCRQQLYVPQSGMLVWLDKK